MKFCSKKCSSSAMVHSQETKDKMSKTHIKNFESGINKGWSAFHSKEKNMSYPEKYVQQILNDLNIYHEREVGCGRWFIDFADTTNKLALEVDGKQHKLPKQKESDSRKDAHLSQNGWKILRIPWRKVDLDFRNEIILKIKEFFNWKDVDRKCERA